MKRDCGVIINMNGGGSTYPLPGGSAYGSSKAALLRFTETLARELERVGSRVWASRTDQPGLWANLSHLEADRWVNDGCQALWGYNSADGLTPRRENMTHVFNTLKFGAPSMIHLTDIGMIFVRCRGGISHNPLEFVTVADIGLAVEALIRTIVKIAGED